MGPCPTGPVDPPYVSIDIPAPHSSAPAQRPSTPSHVSVGASLIHFQHTPPQTLMSRGCSPVLMFDLIPPDLISLFNDTQMQATQQSPVYADLDIVSVTSSKLEIERAPLKSLTRPRSLEFVPETQMVGGIEMDYLVRPPLLVFIYLLTQFPDSPDVVDGTRVKAQEAIYGPGSIIRCSYKPVLPCEMIRCLRLHLCAPCDPFGLLPPTSTAYMRTRCFCDKCHGAIVSIQTKLNH